MPVTPPNAAAISENNVAESVSFTEADILEAYSDYDLLYNAYHGKGGFKTGGYIARHPRESRIKWIRRCKISYYTNYLRPIIDSHVNPIFIDDPSREWNTNKLFDQYVADADARGTSLSRFMKKAALVAKIYAVAFIVTDNFADLPTNLAQTLQDRKLPYSYIVNPNMIETYKVNRFNKLTSITIREPAEDADGNVSRDDYNLRTWTNTTWELRKQGGEFISSSEHSLGRLPVTALYSNQVEDDDVLPQSEFYDIAKISLAMFNRCSELDEILTNQTFNLLVVPLGSGQRGKNPSEIVTGTENVLGFDGREGGRPEFIAPDSGPAEVQLKQLDRLVTECHRMAQLSHVTGTEKKESGIAKAYDFQKTNQNLADFAANIEEAEKDIAKIFSLWVSGNKDSLNYSVAYERDFGISDIDQMLKDADAALMMNMGSKFDAAVKKKVVAIYLGDDIPQEEYDAIVKEIEANADDAYYASQSLKLLDNKTQEAALPGSSPPAVDSAKQESGTTTQPGDQHSPPTPQK